MTFQWQVSERFLRAIPSASNKFLLQFVTCKVCSCCFVCRWYTTPAVFVRLWYPCCLQCLACLSLHSLLQRINILWSFISRKHWWHVSHLFLELKTRPVWIGDEPSVSDSRLRIANTCVRRRLVCQHIYLRQHTSSRPDNNSHPASIALLSFVT